MLLLLTADSFTEECQFLFRVYVVKFREYSKWCMMSLMARQDDYYFTSRMGIVICCLLNVFSVVAKFFAQYSMLYCLVNIVNMSHIFHSEVLLLHFRDSGAIHTCHNLLT